MKKITFKEYLLEFDIGDRQLQQQATDQQNQAAGDEKARGAFSSEMTNASPNKGDVIESNDGRFLVLGGSMEGIKIKELGGNRSGTIPHGTKFKSMGQGKSGKNVFSIIQNS